MDAAAAAEEERHRAGERKKAEYASRARADPKLLAAAGLPARTVHAAFASLSGRCVATTASEYTYEACFFTKATQRASGHGGHSFSLGRRWRWAEHTSDGTPTGEFEGGDRCPDGTERSLRVRFACTPGVEVLGQVSEYSTCRYEVLLETAAAC